MFHSGNDEVDDDRDENSVGQEEEKNETNRRGDPGCPNWGASAVSLYSYCLSFHPFTLVAFMSTRRSIRYSVSALIDIFLSLFYSGTTLLPNIEVN